MRANMAPLRVALVYVLAGALWIGLTDRLLLALAPDALRTGQGAKGIVFVLLSATLIFFLVRRELIERKRLESERNDLLRRLAGSQRLEAIGRLTGGIAHDFNNLLTAISGNLESYIERISEDGEPEDLTEISEAVSAARSAEELTGQLLAFGRQQEMRPQPVDLNGVIEETGHLLHRLIGNRIHIETSLADDLWVTEMDRGPLQQIVMNLALNARDAMPRGGSLTLATDNTRISDEQARQEFSFPVRPGEYVRLIVEDTGTGMEPEVCERIYEPFFTTKKKDVGTGLGMSTVYGIVKQSGGYIDLHSTLGEGTRFDLYFPKAEGAPAASAPGAAVPVNMNGTETILVVEDQAAVRSLIIRILERRGFTTVPCPSAADALDFLRDGHHPPVDLLLTDAIMPGIDGLELIERARGLHPHLPVLLMSGYAVSDAESGHPYLPKPFTADDLVARIRGTLREEGAEPR